jgi:hypothetical protein
MIAELGSLHNVFMSTQRDLKEFKNMTNSASYLLSAIYPAVRRSLRTVDTYGKKISMDSIQAMVDHLQPKFIGRKTECIAVLYLNHRYKILHEEWEEGEYPERIGVDSMAILKRAVKEGASYIAFAHNHPSQDLTPSREDIVETTKMFADLDCEWTYELFQEVQGKSKLTKLDINVISDSISSVDLYHENDIEKCRFKNKFKFNGDEQYIDCQIKVTCKLEDMSTTALLDIVPL